MIFRELQQNEHHFRVSSKMEEIEVIVKNPDLMPQILEL